MAHKEHKEACKCDEEIKSLKEELSSCEQKYLRALADYNNQSRRLEEDRLKLMAFANEELLTELIVIYSDLKIAKEHIKDAGLDKIIENWKKILTKFGVEEMQIDINETVFDPAIHEAIESIEGEEGKILKVFRSGYFLNTKVIQTALVSVGIKK